jgi:hypothetical protein
MRLRYIIPAVLLTLGLVALGIGAGIQPGGPDDSGEGTFVLLMGLSFFGFGLVLVSTWVLLWSALPTPADEPLSQREGRLGGILVAVPLGVGLLGACVGHLERSPLYVPLLLLGAVAGSVASWFLAFCLRHQFVQDRPVVFKGLWVVLFLLGNLLALPLYWYAFVWRPHVALPLRRKA